MLEFYLAAEFKVNSYKLKATHTEWFKLSRRELERSNHPAICSKAGTAAFPDRMTFQTYVYLACFSDEDNSEIIYFHSRIIQKSTLLQFKSLFLVKDKLFSRLQKPPMYLKVVTMSPLSFILSSISFSYSSYDTLQLVYVSCWDLTIAEQRRQHHCMSCMSILILIFPLMHSTIMFATSKTEHSSQVLSLTLNLV